MSPGMMRARPGRIGSCCRASATSISILGSLCSRLANSVVKAGGMCCTITMPGRGRGKTREQLLQGLHAPGAHAADDDPFIAAGAGRIGELGQDHVGRVPGVGRARRDDRPETAAGRHARRCECSRAGFATTPTGGSRRSSRAWR